MEPEKGGGGAKDTERLNFIMEQGVAYIYIGEEQEARDLNTRAKIDAAMKAQEDDLR